MTARGRRIVSGKPRCAIPSVTMLPPFTFIDALTTKTRATRIEIILPVQRTFPLTATLCLLARLSNVRSDSTADRLPDAAEVLVDVVDEAPHDELLRAHGR